MSSTLNIVEEPSLRGSFVDWLDKDFMLFSKKNKIYKSDYLFDKIELVGSVPQKAFKKLVSANRFGKRLLRQTMYNVIPLSNDFYFVSFGDQIGYMEKGEFTRIRGTENSGRILRQGACKAKNNKIYWGSYLSNKDRRSKIEIFEFDPSNKNLSVVYTFDQQDIRHVHRVTHADSKLWVTTGDLPDECKFLWTEDYFSDFKIAYEGDETWRSVGLQFRNKDIYYASDSEYIENYIYKVNTRTNVRISLKKINAPCYYSTRFGNDILFATTAELCPSQKDTEANIYHVDSNTDIIQKVFSGKKDLVSEDKIYTKTPLVSKLFQNGIINFPGNTDHSLEFTYFSCQGLKGLDFKVFKVFR